MLAIPIFLLLILLYFHPVLSASYIFVERDLSAFFIPPRYLWVSLAKSFEIPLWNPYNSSGIPLLATLQPGVFYPPHIFYLFLPFNIVWNWIIILHFVFAGATIYVFLRYLKASSDASFVGGIVFMLSGYLLSIHNLLPHLLAVPWFPLIVMSFLKYFDTGRLKYLVYTAMFLSIEFFAGAPEIVMMSLIVLVLLALFPILLFEKYIGYSFRIKSLCFIGVLSFLLSSVQLLPFLELKTQSIRKTGLTYLEATTWSFMWKDFILFFLPDFFGYFRQFDTVKFWLNQCWLKTLYLGVMPFVFSIFYFLSRDKKRVLFLILITISFIFALGKNTPFYNLFYYIPPFNSIRFPVKFLFLFFFVIAVTSGLGIDSLRKGIQNKNSKIKLAILIVFYSGFLFAGLWGCINLFENDVIRFCENHGIKPEEYHEISFNIHNLKRFLFFSFLFCVFLLSYFRMKYKRTIMYVIIFLLTADLFFANYDFHNRVNWQWYISENKEFVETISKDAGTERYFITKKTFRDFEHFPNDRAIQAPAYAALFGIYTMDGSEVLRVMHHDLFITLTNSTPSISEAKRFFDMSGVRHVITSYKVEDKDFKLIKSLDVGDKTAYLYEYSLYPGRFLLFAGATFVKDDKTVIEKLQSDAFDKTKELLLIGQKESTQGRGLMGQAKLLSYKANKVVLEYEADSDAFLYVSDTYYPGWHAYVDGKETKIYRANLAFRAIEAPKGKHTVVFKYIPMSFYIGLVLTMIGIALCIWLWRRDNDKITNNQAPTSR